MVLKYFHIPFGDSRNIEMYHLSTSLFAVTKLVHVS